MAVDVIYISNHGGRQLDHGSAPSTRCRKSLRGERQSSESSSTAE